MLISKYDENVSAFLPHGIKRKAKQDSFIGSKIASSIEVNLTETTQSFYGAVSVSGGAVLIPYSSGVIGLVSNDGEYSRGPSVPGSARFKGGCRLDDGRIVMAPVLSPTIGIYDPETNKYVNGPAPGLGTGSGPGFSGCCQAANGMVVLAPFNRSTIGLYDPKTNIYTEGPAHGEADSSFAGCIPLPNGKVLLIPYAALWFGVYDPVTNTYSRGAALSGGGKLAGGVALANGDVVCTPCSHDYILTYQWKTDTFYQINTGIDAAVNLKFIGSGLTVDGRVVFAPYNYPNIVIYNPKDDSVVNLSAFGTGSRMAGAAVLSNGKVVMAPHSHTKVVIVDSYDGVTQTIDDPLRLNRYFNTSF